MKMRRLAIVALILFAGASSPVTARVDDPMPNGLIGDYVFVGRSDLLGDLQLNDRFAAFSHLSGHMDLQFWDVERDSPDDELSGAQIFRVLNANDFFAKNKGKNGFCGEAPKWFVIGKMEPIYPFRPPGQVRIFLITIDDLRRFSWAKPVVCSELYYRFVGRTKPI